MLPREPTDSIRDHMSEINVFLQNSENDIYSVASTREIVLVVSIVSAVLLVLLASVVKYVVITVVAITILLLLLLLFSSSF